MDFHEKEPVKLQKRSVYQLAEHSCLRGILHSLARLRVCPYTASLSHVDYVPGPIQEQDSQRRAPT
jgi:hypothetical protein